MQREIVLDTETTGLHAHGDDRIIEIGCIELLNRIPSGKEFHCYINPQREVPAEAEAVHGLSTAFLKDKPLFQAIADPFLEFIEADTLVIHNAGFDIGFLNAELERLDKPLIGMDRVVDTLQLARRKHPAGPNSLDALCKRYGIDNSKRIKHGALMDSVLLADVYLELLGERQATLELSRLTGNQIQKGRQQKQQTPQRQKPLPTRITLEEKQAHSAFIETLGNDAMWNRYLEQDRS